jgi:hypothetical protein
MGADSVESESGARGGELVVRRVCEAALRKRDGGQVPDVEGSGAVLFRIERLPPGWGAHRGQPKFRRPLVGGLGKETPVGSKQSIMNHNKNKSASNRHVLHR